MNLIRALFASLLSLVCTLSVSSFVTLATLETTALDRHEVKTWLNDSGAYKNLPSAALAASQNPADQTQNNTAGITADSVKAAFNQTLTPTFVQQQSEKAIDNAFDWLEGKQPTLSLNIDATGQKDTFIQNFSTAIKSQLAKLPTCKTADEFQSDNPTCVPPGTNISDLAQNLATSAGSDVDVFQKPITNDTPNNAPASQQAPAIVASLHQWLLLLPIIAAASGALSVMLSRDRLKAAKLLNRRLTFGLIVTLVVGIVMAYFGKSIKLTDFFSGNQVVLSTVVEPIIHQAVPAIGTRLAMISGILGAVTLILWITFQTLWESREKAKLPAQVEAAAPVNSSPTADPHADPSAESINHPTGKQK